MIIKCFFKGWYYVLDAKRLIGRKFEDPAVQSDKKHWPFDVVSDGGKPKVEVKCY